MWKCLDLCVNNTLDEQLVMFASSASNCENDFKGCTVNLKVNTNSHNSGSYSYRQIILLLVQVYWFIILYY